jgi:hypothetical protein
MSTQTIARHRRSGGAITYPMHHVLGIIPSPSDLPAITAELQTAGFAERAICVLCGEADSCCLDAEGARHGPLVHLLRWWQHFTPEYAHLARYEQAVRDGQCVVAVRAYHHLDWEPIQRILAAHGGHFIHYYGWMIHDLME